MKFTIPAVPQAKGRPRFSTRGGFPRSYTPKKTRAYEQLVGWCALQARVPLFSGPVFIKAEFYFEWPKGQHRKRKPKEQEFMPVGRDLDNLCKSLLDGLNGHAWRDDSQVVWLVARKYRCAQGEEARTEVEISEVCP